MGMCVFLSKIARLPITDIRVRRKQLQMQTQRNHYAVLEQTNLQLLEEHTRYMYGDRRDGHTEDHLTKYVYMYISCKLNLHMHNAS